MADSVLARVVTVFVTFCLMVVFGVPVLIGTLYRMVKNRQQYFYKKDRPEPPACLNDPTLGEQKIITLPNQAIKLHYATAGSEDKPLMLCVHGFPEFWYSWRHQIREFKKSYRVVAVDNRGYGHSDHPQGLRSYKINKLRDDIKELITVLGYDKCVLVAHDWGGAIAWSFNIYYPEMVDRLIIMNCPHPMAFKMHIQQNKSQILKSWYMFVFQWPYLPELLFSNNDFKMLEWAFRGKKGGAKEGAFTNEDIEAYKYTFGLDNTVTTSINYYRANFHRQEDEEKLKRPIENPVLVIWGDRDQFLEKGMAELSAQFAKDFKLEFIEGGSHWIQQEEPERCNEIMWAFLKTDK